MRRPRIHTLALGFYGVLNKTGCMFANRVSSIGFISYSTLNIWLFAFLRSENNNSFTHATKSEPKWWRLMYLVCVFRADFNCPHELHWHGLHKVAKNTNRMTRVRYGINRNDRILIITPAAAIDFATFFLVVFFLCALDNTETSIAFYGR